MAQRFHVAVPVGCRGLVWAEARRGGRTDVGPYMIGADVYPLTERMELLREAGLFARRNGAPAGSITHSWT